MHTINEKIFVYVLSIAANLNTFVLLVGALVRNSEGESAMAKCRLHPKTADFFQKIFFLNYYNIFKISKLEFLLDPELRGRSTGSMIRGTTAAVRLRRPSVT